MDHKTSWFKPFRLADNYLELKTDFKKFRWRKEAVLISVARCENLVVSLPQLFYLDRNIGDHKQYASPLEKLKRGVEDFNQEQLLNCLLLDTHFIVDFLQFPLPFFQIHILLTRIVCILGSGVGVRRVQEQKGDDIS
jgi:hypothetical protein